MVRALVARIILGALVLFSMVPPAAAADWAVYQEDGTHNGVGEGVIGSELFAHETRRPDLDYYALPLYANGNYYFLEYSNSLTPEWMVSAQSREGDELWRTTGVGPVKSGFAINDGLVLVPGQSLTALDAITGEKQWDTAPEAHHSFMFPLAVGSVVVAIERDVSGYSGFLTAVDRVTGLVQWRKSISTYGMHGLSRYRDSVIITYGNINNSTCVDSYLVSNGTKNWSYIRGFNATGPAVIDETAGYGFVSNTGGILVQIDLATGVRVREYDGGASATISVLVNGKAYFLTNISNSLYLNCIDYSAGVICPQKRVTTDFSAWMGTNPIVVGERMYVLSPQGDLWHFRLDGSDAQSAVVADGVYLQNMIYADGNFLILADNATVVYGVADVAPEYHTVKTISLESPYEGTEGWNEYLGQTHAHYIWEYGEKKGTGDPMPVLQRYADAGYDFVALTEHNRLTEEIIDPPLLWINNNEEDTQGKGGNHILGIGVQTMADENRGDQARIDTFADDGGFVSLAHPNSYFYGWSLAELMSMKNSNAVEVYNSALGHGGNSIEFWGWLKKKDPKNSAYAIDRWDELLKLRKPVWATAGDDSTPGEPGFDGAAVSVFSPSLSQADILNSLKAGKYYARQGSLALDMRVTTSGQTISVTTSYDADIEFISLNGETVKEDDGITYSSYTVNGNEQYVRVEVSNPFGISYSQPIRVRREEVKVLAHPGKRTIRGEAFMLKAETGTGLAAGTVPTDQLPTEMPAWGYISPVYNFEGALAAPATLEVSYAGQALPIGDHNLSLFTYDEATRSWRKVTSVVDSVRKTVTASLSHFSYYVLSSDLSEDTVAPTVTVMAPDLSGLVVGEQTLAVSTVDNNQTIKVRGILDDAIELFSDSDYSDGFAPTVDFGRYLSGSHTLTLWAEDAFGNMGSTEYTITIGGGITGPTITINDPVADATCSRFTVSGSVTSTLPVRWLRAYDHNDYYIADINLADGQFNTVLERAQLQGDLPYTVSLWMEDAVGNQTNQGVKLTCPATVATPSETLTSTTDQISDETTLSPVVPVISSTVQAVTVLGSTLEQLVIASTTPSSQYASSLPATKPEPPVEIDYDNTKRPREYRDTPRVLGTEAQSTRDNNVFTRYALMVGILVLLLLTSLLINKCSKDKRCDEK